MHQVMKRLGDLMRFFKRKVLNEDPAVAYLTTPWNTHTETHWHKWIN